MSRRLPEYFVRQLLAAEQPPEAAPVSAALPTSGVLGPESVALTVYGQPLPQGNKTAYPFVKTGPDGNPLFRFDARTNRRVPVLGVRLVEGRDKKQQQAFEQYREAITTVARALYRGAPLDGPLEAQYKFFLRRPKKPSWEEPAGPPDLEKLIRAVNDALKGVLLSDDSRIVRYDKDTGKYWTDPREERGPRVEITLRPLR